MKNKNKPTTRGIKDRTKQKTGKLSYITNSKDNPLYKIIKEVNFEKDPIILYIKLELCISHPSLRESMNYIHSISYLYIYILCI